jgi:hypothetical protein
MPSDRIPDMRIALTAICLLIPSAVELRAQITVKDYRATMTAKNRAEVADMKCTSAAWVKESFGLTARRLVGKRLCIVSPINVS